MPIYNPGITISLLRRVGLALFLIALAACQKAATATTDPPGPTPLADAPTSTPVTADAIETDQPVVAEPAPQATTLPQVMIRIPVLPAARDTAAALWAAEHPPADHYRLALELLGIQPARLTPQATPVSMEINQRGEFFINANLAGDYQPIPVRLRHISEHAYWWASVTVRASDEDIVAAAKRFEEEVLPINRLIFGVEPSPGIDNDHRLHLLLVEQPSWGGYYGYFSKHNQFPRSIVPHSNEKEMFVINLGGVRMDSPAFSGELAHEYQHLIHWNLDPNEDHWLNEAMGELAIFLVGAPEASSAVGKTNAELFAENPGIQLTSRPETDPGDNADPYRVHYAAERLFAIYLLEQFGPQFIKDLVNNPNPGVISLQQELDKIEGSPRFNDVYASWLVANLLDRPDLGQGQYGYQEIDPLIPQPEVIRSFRGETLTKRLPPYGAHYYHLQSDQPVKVSFAGETMARLTPVDPASGGYAWYSNRGDETEFSLSRSFDLTNLDKATLNYKVWYQLDEYYDYAYVEVSTDGGKSWEILETAHGTDRDPRDVAYGFGYTDSTIRWLTESIDLGAYTGREIQVRFHVITDFTHNRDGLQIDDIEIPELDYFDGAEDDSGDWEARGFVRSANVVPAEWIMWLVKFSSPPEIVWIEFSPDQTTDFEIRDFGEGYSDAALIVSPAAPVTTMDLNYELIFQRP